MLVLKLDGDGRLLWAKTYGGTGRSGGSSADEANSIQETSDQGFIIAGESWSSGVGYGDFLVIRLDAQGEVMWQRTYGHHYVDCAYSIKQTFDGEFIIAGHSRSFGSGIGDILMLKVDSNGNLIWQRLYMATERTIPSMVELTSDGGYLVAGYVDFPDNEDDDLLALKLDANGNIEWEKVYRGESSGEAYAVRQTLDRGFLFVGESHLSGPRSSDMMIVKTDEEGNPLWAKTVGTPCGDWADAVVETQDHGYTVAGSLCANLAVVRFDSSGNLSLCPPWLEIHDATLTQSDAGMQVANSSVVVGTPNFGASVSLEVASSSRTADSPCTIFSPIVTTLMADSITTTSAIIKGSVNPNGVFTRAWFYWGTSNRTSEMQGTSAQTIDPISNTVTISVKLTGLRANTRYYYVPYARNSSRYIIGQMLHFTTGSGLMVWPGDTNNDGIANQADVLPLGLYWARTGPERDNASINWIGQPATPWTPASCTYADANGDGLVNQADVLAIGLNFGRTHTSAYERPSSETRRELNADEVRANLIEEKEP